MSGYKGKYRYAAKRAKAEEASNSILPRTASDSCGWTRAMKSPAVDVVLICLTAFVAG
jgi:hypothetical protein